MDTYQESKNITNWQATKSAFNSRSKCRVLFMQGGVWRQIPPAGTLLSIGLCIEFLFGA
jgi:hypothetical protein